MSDRQPYLPRGQMPSKRNALRRVRDTGHTVRPVAPLTYEIQIDVVRQEQPDTSFSNPADWILERTDAKYSRVYLRLKRALANPSGNPSWCTAILLLSSVRSNIQADPADTDHRRIMYVRNQESDAFERYESYQRIGLTWNNQPFRDIAFVGGEWYDLHDIDGSIRSVTAYGMQYTFAIICVMQYGVGALALTEYDFPDPDAWGAGNDVAYKIHAAYAFETAAQMGGDFDLRGSMSVGGVRFRGYPDIEYPPW